MKVLSLFSGVGLLDYGLQCAGFQIVGQCQIDPYCRQVLKHHWPDTTLFQDVNELTIKNAMYLEPDMIVGGFPCQDVSSSGRGLGVQRGERSGLWRQFFRLVQGCKPKWILIQNVPALRTRGADIVLANLESENYTCWSLVVGAQHVGAPHKRHRVWIVAYDNGALESTRLSRAIKLAVQGNTKVSNNRGDRCRWPRGKGVAQHTWEAERIVKPGLGESANGGTRGMDATIRRCEIKALGNGVVPKIPEVIGRCILKTMEHYEDLSV